MQKLISSEKQVLKAGIGLSSIIFMVIGLGVGVANVVGASVSGAKNIEAAGIQAPEVVPILTNSIFTNTYKTNMY